MMALKFGGSQALTGLYNLWESYLRDNSTKNQLVQYLKSFIEGDIGHNVVTYVAELKEPSLAKLLLSRDINRINIEDVKMLASSFGIDALRNLLEQKLKEFDFNTVADFLQMFPDNALAHNVVPHLLTKTNYCRYNGRSTTYEKALIICQKFNIALSDDTRKQILSSESSDNISRLYELGCKLNDVFCLLEVLKKSFQVNSYNRYGYYGNQNQNNILNVAIIINCVQTIGLDNCKTILENLISDYVRSTGIMGSLNSIELFNSYTQNMHITDFIVKLFIKSILATNNITNQNISDLEKIFVIFYKCGAIAEMNVLVDMITPTDNSKYHSFINPLIMNISRWGPNILESQPIQIDCAMHCLL